MTTEKTGIIKALLKFLDTNEIEGRIFFGAIGVAIIIFAVGFTVHLPEIIQSVKCK